MRKGTTHKFSDGSGSIRKGVTPGGRDYSSIRSKSGDKLTKITSGITTWAKNTAKGLGVNKIRETATNNGFGSKDAQNIKKGPTRKKAGYGATHTFGDGGKLRQGVTPGGRKYKTTHYAGGIKTTKVGGLVKTTSPYSGKSTKGSLTTGKVIEKGQTKAKK
jgi:hypothetical protein